MKKIRTPGTGGLRQRGARSWELKFESGADENGHCHTEQGVTAHPEQHEAVVGQPLAERIQARPRGRLDVLGRRDEAGGPPGQHFRCCKDDRRESEQS